MFGIKLNNTFLTLYPKTSLGFELYNPAYLGDKVDEIANGLIFSVKVPLSGDNARLLRYPHVVENDWRFLKDEACEIWKNGRIVFLGELTVKKANVFAREPSCELRIMVNTISKLRDLKMSALDLGTINMFHYFTFDLPTDTCLNPHDYDYIFHPVWNPDFRDKKDTITFGGDEFQNLWDSTVRQGRPYGQVVLSENSVLTPFLKLSYLLKKMFENVGFTLNNQFQTTPELRLLTVYNNMSVLSSEGFANFIQFHLNWCVSDTTCGAYLTKLSRLFSIAPYVNMFDKKVNLVPFKDVLGRAAKHDWTAFVRRGGELSESNNYPNVLAYKAFADSPMPKGDDLKGLSRITADPDLNNPSIPPILVLTHVVEAIYTLSSGVKVYHKPVFVERGGTALPLIRYERYLLTENDEINQAGSGEKWESDLGTLNQAQIWEQGATNRTQFVPTIRLKGKFPADAEKHKFSDRLLFYRGIRPHRGDPSNPQADGYFFFPLATAEDVAIDGKPTLVGKDKGDSPVIFPQSERGVPPQYSLNFTGENGIYNRFGKPNFAFLSEKRDLTARLDLPLDELMQFSFEDKVRIKNMEYLVKKIHGVLKADGELVDIEADLVTVV